MFTGNIAISQISTQTFEEKIPEQQRRSDWFLDFFLILSFLRKKVHTAKPWEGNPFEPGVKWLRHAVNIIHH